MAFYACGINSTKYVSSASQAKRIMPLAEDLSNIKIGAKTAMQN
ncbi:hypothetical protein QYS42_26015 [Klebsiella pneumoniae]|nr:hypothetical protein [Klebsiella pneumoniae]MDS6688564.1 hypothetical protein [Klebsiella pneumoniae]